MARSCKCHITGETGTTDTFVKIGKYYYKNQEIYDAEQKRKETYKSLIDYICYEFLGYGDGQPFHTSLPKKIKELSFYDYETILETFQKCHDDICYWMEHKQFETEYGKLSYIFAMVKDKLSDVRSDRIRREKQSENTKKTEIECGDLSSIGTKHRGKDISSFLNDDEL